MSFVINGLVAPDISIRSRIIRAWPKPRKDEAAPLGARIGGAGNLAEAQKLFTQDIFKTETAVKTESKPTLVIPKQ